MCASLQYYTVLVYASVLVGAVHFRLFLIFKAHFHCQAHLLDTIYCVHIPRYIYIQCTPVPCSLRSPARACARVRVAVVPPARSLPADRHACARVRPPARVCAGVCVGAVRLPSSRLPCISFAYNVYSPPLCPTCPPRCSLRSLRRKLF